MPMIHVGMAIVGVALAETNESASIEKQLT